MKHCVTIEYCPKCRWLLRAAYMAQELLTSFEGEISALILRPSETDGRYSIFVNDEIVFDRKRHGGFADIKEIKQRVRDAVAPGKNLGHTDRLVGS